MRLMISKGHFSLTPLQRTWPTLMVTGVTQALGTRHYWLNGCDLGE